MKKKLVVLTGAGISQESGLKTFRDQGGLWENHNIEDVATPEAFQKNPELVLSFYNQRRKQLLEAEPNEAHKLLADLEQYYDLTIITQNVDDFHERAGSQHVIHLHGELLKSRSIINPDKIYDQKKDILIGDTDENGHQLRPHVVWFGEAVAMIPYAMNICKIADTALVIGTSLQVYPAAGLINDVPDNAMIYLIDPNPQVEAGANLKIIKDKAVSGMKSLYNQLINQN
ncbi:MAG: Sir2 family NAD-dependent protein deacetylase [Psychroflexus sp.]|nr:Sir2 family NAD-dependent protein deacetylase [Psychroflexus sp.]